MNYSSDIVIHINEKLDNQNRVLLTDRIQKFTGVLTTSLQDSRPHLMIIGYNRGKTKALDILIGIRKTGVQAQLIAWLWE